MTNRGIHRERQVRDTLEDDDWVVIRAAGSLGFCDLIALKDGHFSRFIEVKATHRGPYHGFPPAKRADLKAVATRAGALAQLAWWPPRGKLHWVDSSEWPA
jgi:Holliday junction resolvase